jgi:hypothetical protein
MLSLGAPFWGHILSRLLRARSEVQSRKEREPPLAERYKEETRARAEERAKAEERGKLSSRRGSQLGPA